MVKSVVLYCRIVDEHVLCSLEIHEKQKGGKSSMVSSQDKLQLGEIVTVRLVKIWSFEM